MTKSIKKNKRITYHVQNKKTSNCDDNEIFYAPIIDEVTKNTLAPKKWRTNAMQ